MSGLNHIFFCFSFSRSGLAEDVGEYDILLNELKSKLDYYVVQSAKKKEAAQKRKANKLKRNSGEKEVDERLKYARCGTCVCSYVCVCWWQWLRCL